MSGKKIQRAAPAESSAVERLMPRGLTLPEDKLLSPVLNRLQGLLAVINHERRVVFVNQAFLDFFGTKDSGEIYGAKPGEIFKCAHAARGECGDTDDCRMCGANQAIEETRSAGVAATREYRAAAHDFRVRTMPFELYGNSYILVSLRDISGEKRKAALERIFFHDILNTASSIKVYVDLLKPGVTEGGSRRLLERLESITETLLEEIQSQKILVSAENKTLTVQKNLISAPELVTEVIRQFDEQDIGQGKKIVTAPFSENISLVSDDSLLRRVLANAVKNALEASEEGSTVSIGYGQRDGTALFWVHNPGSIGEDIKGRIFQRYFSTKGDDRGLGTYGMKLLTEEYLGGRVSFESAPDTGTTFTITLPIRP
jgi:signal transduction histidine kinase